MALEHTRVGDADKLCLLQLRYRLSTTVPHTGAQATNHLEHHLFKRTDEGDTRRDSFGHKLFHIFLFILKIPILRSPLHRFKGAHTTIRLVASAVVQYGFPGRFLSTSQ